MQVQINPGTASGSISAPPSKSMAHRLIICAALSEGTSRISNLSYSQDILATLDCIRAMGATVSEDGDTVTVTGVGSNPNCDGITFPCRESGSTMRFFMAISMRKSGKCRFLGSETLRNRPFSVYETICKEQNIGFVRNSEDITVDGAISAGNYTLPGDVSSQFITGLLFVLPTFSEDSTITLTNHVESRSYLNLTISALSDFGVRVFWDSENVLKVPGNQTYKARDLRVEGDYSNAAFLEAFNLLGGSVTVTGLRDDSLQGDRIYREYYPMLQSEHAVLDLSDCPDLGPILLSLAAALHGAVFTGTRRLRMKESDRGTVMCEELAKFGIRATQEENEITVYPGTLQKPSECLLGHNDHRIVMSLATLCTITGGTIDGAQAVAKSFPDYFERIRELGIEVTEHGMD